MTKMNHFRLMLVCRVKKGHYKKKKKKFMHGKKKKGEMRMPVAEDKQREKSTSEMEVTLIEMMGLDRQTTMDEQPEDRDKTMKAARNGHHHYQSSSFQWNIDIPKNKVITVKEEGEEKEVEEEQMQAFDSDDEDKDDNDANSHVTTTSARLNEIDRLIVNKKDEPSDVDFVAFETDTTSRTHHSSRFSPNFSSIPKAAVYAKQISTFDIDTNAQTNIADHHHAW
ncbi:hypothetical protein RFI_14399 [Reticulomyxa filosa]|uniref:Uncharacterized protein n=1 Tax=Reticulomyxa filosa TaxID=46433 RepID=X6N923_RETFI|nr:hypothetical protein RFI_14399 [Reticulomyxa filosa]|eukprot:ETO22795.1 hypothetical protein RFI_14399 [Reticulomyxa filosa]